MTVSRDELLHIASLAMLSIEENEIDKYLQNLQDILNFANIVNKADTQDVGVTIGTNEAKNRFRKDEVKVFENTEALLANGKDVEQNMFKLPKVIN